MIYIRNWAVGIVLAAGLIVGMTSCSKMNKLLKSGDVELIYQEGIKAYEAKKWRKASSYFEVAYNSLYTTGRVDTVLFYLGNAQYNLGLYDISADIFDQYRKNHGKRSFSEEAEFLLPMSYYKMSRTVERDQTETRKAMVAFTEYLNRYPESVRADDIKTIMEEMQLKLYEKEYINASLYEKLRQYPAAVTALRNALKESPESPYREEMMYLICKSWYEYATNSIPQRKLDRYMKMVDAYYNFVAEFPDSKSYRKSLDKMYVEGQAYVEHNQKITMDIEKNKIDIESRQESIDEQKKQIKTITDPLERRIAKNKLKAEQESLRQLKKQIKVEAKFLKNSGSKKKLSKATTEEPAATDE